MREHVDRYVEALLSGKRPKPFAPTQEEVSVLAAAIDLTAGQSNDAEPRPAFVEQLRKQLEHERQNAERDASPRPAWRVPARRRLLAAGALTVSGAAVGAAGAQLFALGGSAASAEAPTAPEVLTPTHGTWQTVADGTEIPEGAVLAFDLGPVSGFVRRTGGRVQAVSGSCTHQGCRLELTASHAEIACPCHGATFALTGVNLTRPRLMNKPLPALPRLPVREQDGRVQIFAPVAASVDPSASGSAEASPA